MNEDKSVEIKEGLFFFILLGLVSSLVEPRNQTTFTEAHRAIYDPGSTELKVLASLSGSKPEEVQKQIFGCLSALGFQAQDTKH